jgi:hypothetical protein
VLLLLALPGAAWSETIDLSDFGTLSQVETHEDGAGVSVLWGFETAGPQVSQSLFLSGADLEPIDLDLEAVQVTDTNTIFDDSPDTAVITYEGGSVAMQISLLLRGVPMEGLAIGDLVETILVWNDSDDTLFLNQVVVTGLWGDPEGDEFVYPSEPGNTNRVRLEDGLAIFEEVVTPEAAFDFFEEAGDSAFLMSWQIEPGEFLLVSKDKSLRVVPEPGTAAMAGLGLLGLAILGRRSRQS